MKYRILIIIVVILSLLTFCSCIFYTYYYHGYRTSKVFLTDDDIYVMNLWKDFWDDNANFYWKNGEKHYVDYIIRSMYVYNDTVYTVTQDNDGYINYYINGDKHETGITGVPVSMFVYEGEVYIAGVYEEEIEEYKKRIRAFYWSETDGYFLLTDPEDSGSEHYNYGVTSIFVDEGNVYISGYSGSWPRYWVNNEINTLDGYTADALFVEDGDIYIAGTSFSVYGSLYACYWENGERVDLDTGWVYDIYVEQDNVYVVGVHKDNNTENETGCYWINGKQIDFSSVIRLTGIAVKDSSVVTAGYDVNSVGGFLSTDINVYRYPYCWIDSFRTSLSN